MKLDIACGQRLQAEWIGLDIAPEENVYVEKGAKYIEHNVLKFPWPIASGSVDQARCSHFVEHIPHKIEGCEKDGLIAFMEEVYRVLKPEGVIVITCPYYLSQRAHQDPTHCRSITEMTFWYFSSKWMKAMAMSHYGIRTNFEVVQTHMVVDDDFLMKTNEEKEYARKHIPNAVSDIIVTLVKREEEV